MYLLSTILTDVIICGLLTSTRTCSCCVLLVDSWWHVERVYVCLGPEFSVQPLHRVQLRDSTEFGTVTRYSGFFSQKCALQRAQQDINS